LWWLFLVILNLKLITQQSQKIKKSLTFTGGMILVKKLKNLILTLCIISSHGLLFNQLILLGIVAFDIAKRDARRRGSLSRIGKRKEALE